MSDVNNRRNGSRRSRSAIWTLFTPDKTALQMAICNICNNKFSYKTSTSNLKRHMLSRHPTVSMNFVTNPRHHLSTIEDQEDMEHDGFPTVSALRETEQATTSFSSNTSSQPGPTSSSGASSNSVLNINTNNAIEVGQTQNKTQYPRQLAISSYLPKKIPVSTKKKFDDKLLQLFTEDFQPFSIVEDKGFKAFVKELNPSYDLPCRKHISNTLIPAKFENCLHTTKTMLTNTVSVCLTTDTWTSINTDSFMAVTAHFIDEDFKMSSALLQCAQFSGRHTSENLADELKKVQSDWQLKNKILLTVSDNASNITKAVKDLLKWKHLGCFAHSLNLIVSSALDKNVVILTLLQNVRGIVSHFKRSTTSNEKLMAYQANNTPDRNQLKLIQDVSTRWNSTFYMLERFALLEETVKATVALIDKDIRQLSNDEWKMVHELVKLLKPFETVTRHASGEKYATASLVIPITLGLQDVCKKLLLRNHTPAVKEVASALANGVIERFGNYEKSNTLSLATFLDPRYKNCVFSEESIREEVKKRTISLVASKIEQNMLHMANPVPTNHNQESEKGVDEDDDLSIYSYVTDCVAKHKPSGTKQSRAIIEVNRYLDEEILPRKCNPLEWWENNKVDYPYLSKVVRENFCVLCTSVPCERVFSKAGYILSERRNRLTGQKAQQ